MSNLLNDLIEAYNQGSTIKERRIALKLKYIKELYEACSKAEETPIFDEIVDNFCEILQSTRPIDAATLEAIPWAPQEYSFADEFRSDEAFFETFRTYFQDRHAASTITDYINRIKTFRNKYAKAYLVEIYGEECLSEGVEVGHIYENLERILATFKPTTKTELNIYSALKKLNEYKNHRAKA